MKAYILVFTVQKIQAGIVPLSIFVEKDLNNILTIDEYICNNKSGLQLNSYDQWYSLTCKVYLISCTLGVHQLSCWNSSLCKTKTKMELHERLNIWSAMVLIVNNWLILRQKVEKLNVIIHIKFISWDWLCC